MKLRNSHAQDFFRLCGAERDRPVAVYTNIHKSGLSTDKPHRRKNDKHGDVKVSTGI
ncbi:MAG: hypothetical protein LBN34_03285 [Clostridiales Family XIII bacterium]|jgi:hypothetical protein|nr:hypothetical protein [Clostridiales Family XIII bacterium]